jgi:hypothetical protein
MTPERMSSLVGRWVRAYTRNLSTSVAQRRIGEIEADLHDQIATERAQGIDEGRIARSILSRMLRGISADIAWRREAAKPVRPAHRIEDTMHTTMAYRIGLALAAASALFLLWGVAAMGIVGAEGDSFDRLYFAVVGIGIGGALLARLRAQGMAVTLGAMALAVAAITILALILGKQQSPVSSVAEIMMVNALFVALFAAAALLFRVAARGAPSGSRPTVA